MVTGSIGKMDLKIMCFGKFQEQVSSQWNYGRQSPILHTTTCCIGLLNGRHEPWIGDVQKRQNRWRCRLANRLVCVHEET